MSTLDLVAIAYSEFDKIHGPQVKQSYVSSHYLNFNIAVVDAYVNYIILDKEYCDQIVAVELDEYLLLSWSSILDNPKYVRNNFSFAFSFVLKGSTHHVDIFSSTLRKLAKTFVNMEVEYEFLSIPETNGEVSGLLKQIYQHIVTQSHAIFAYTSPHNSVTHYFNINLSRLPSLDSSEIHEYSVPMFVNLCVNLQSLPFDISIQHLVIHIDGISHLKKIAKECEMDFLSVKRAIQLLLYYNVIILSDVFKFSNIYKIASEPGLDVLGSQAVACEMMAFALYPNFLTEYTHTLQNNGDFPYKLLCSQICSLVGEMQCACTLADLLLKFKIKTAHLCKYVDIVRLLAFLQHRHVIKRVYEFPVYIVTLPGIASCNTLVSTNDSQGNLIPPMITSPDTSEGKFMKLTKSKTTILNKHHHHHASSGNMLSTANIANITAGYMAYIQEVLKTLDGSSPHWSGVVSLSLFAPPTYLNASKRMAFTCTVTKILPPEEFLCPHYGGNAHVFKEGFIKGDFLTINKQMQRVTWFGPLGYKIIRTYHLAKVPIHAVFCLCHLFGLPSSEEAPEKLLAVAILLSDFELEIHYASGEKHEVSLPIAVTKLISTPHGLLLQVAGAQNRAVGMSIPLTSTFADLQQQASQFLLIRSPQSSIESLAQSNSPMSTDLDIVATHESMIICRSGKSNTLLLSKLQNTPETSHVLSEQHSSREQSNLSIDKSVLDPALELSNNSSFLRSNNYNTSMHSAQTTQSMNTRSSNSSPRNRPSPLLERGSSNTYDKATLQALLGERSVRMESKKGIERSDHLRGARLSSGSFRSMKSNSPSKLSLPIDNDDIYMEGLDATLDTQSSLQLDCLLQLRTADWRAADNMEEEEESMQNYHVELFCHHETMLLSVTAINYSKHVLFLLEPSTVNASWISRRIYSQALRSAAPALAWVTIDSLTLPLAICPLDHASSELVSGSAVSASIASVASPALGVSTLLSPLPACALSHQNGTYIVRLALPGQLSKLDHNLFLAFEKGLDKQSISLLLVLEALWPSYAQQKEQSVASRWRWIAVILVGLSMQLPWPALSSYCDGQSTSCLLLDQDDYRNLLECYAQAGSSAANLAIDVLYRTYEEFSLRDRTDEAAAVAEVLQEIQGLCRYCIGHGLGDLQQWKVWQQHFDSLVKLGCTLPILTTLQAVLRGDFAAASSFKLSPIIQKVQKLGSGNPLSVLTSLSLWIHSVLDLNSTAQSSGTSLNSSALFVKAFAASVSACISDPKQREDESFWSACLRSLPATLSHLIVLSFDVTREDAEGTWPVALLKLLGRNDLVANQLSSVGSNQENLYADNQTSWSAGNKQLDGLHEVEANSMLRFPVDERVREACRMLRSSVPVYLKVEKAPEDTEVERRQKLQSRLLALCKRILGCSVGRGMMTIGTVQPLMAEALPIPPLCLSGRVPPNNQIVPLDAASATPEHLMWPEFHNGVAAAFRLGKQIKGQAAGYRVTRNWILYNKTNAQQNKQIGEHTHAGVLLGLGLLGHLHVLIVPEICEYLTQGQETTTVAILIGVAASKIGSCDSLFSKTLSLHLPPLLPPEAWDIEISPVVQSSAIVGLGLLYCQSGHRLIIEFLLEELIRKPSTDRCENREGLALSAAWALGMVLLPDSRGQADCLQAIADLRIEERLHSLIIGGERPQTARLFTSDYDVEMNTKSSRILESNYINVNITAPAACIALGIIFMKSRNEKVLGYLAIPTSASALNLIRPDRLFYHALAHCLVEWNCKPVTSSMIIDHVPIAVLDALDADRMKQLSGRYTGPYGRSRQSNAHLLSSTAFLLKINIIGGYGLGLGLVHAGTFNADIKQLLLEQIKWLQKFRDGKGFASMGFTADKMHKVTVDLILCSLCLSLSCVFAGSGDIDIMRTIRELRSKVDDVTYGTHMALSMALGLLFLAGGRCSLKRDPLSVAALLIAILPRYPQRSYDQQCHLQALRQMYILAMEPRVLHTIDVDSKQPVTVDLELVLQDGQKRITQAPGLLPELTSVQSISLVSTDQKRYYPCSMQLHKAADSVSREADSRRKSTLHRGNLQDSILLTPLYVKQMDSMSNKMLEDESKSTAENEAIFSDVLNKVLRVVFSNSAADEKPDTVDQLIGKCILQSPSLLDLLARFMQK